MMRRRAIAISRATSSGRAARSEHPSTGGLLTQQIGYWCDPHSVFRNEIRPDPAVVLDDFLGMQVGHTRQYPREWLAEGDDAAAYRLPESEKLDLELLVRGYTINWAHQFRMEDEIGSIETGKLADMVVLDDNLFAMDRYEIHKIRPTAVVMEGKVVRGGLAWPPLKP